MQNRSFFARARGHAPLKRDRDRVTGTGPPGPGHRDRATGTGPPGPGHRDRATGTGPPGPGHRDRATGTGPPGPGTGTGTGPRDRATGTGLPEFANSGEGLRARDFLVAKGCIRLCDSSWRVLQ